MDIPRSYTHVVGGGGGGAGSASRPLPDPSHAGAELLERMVQVRKALADTGGITLRGGKMVAKPGGFHAMADAYNLLAELAPKVPPVEGDEVFLFIGAERCKGHLLGIRNSGRRAGGQIAWVSIYDLSRDDMDYVTVDYLSLVRA